MTTRSAPAAATRPHRTGRPGRPCGLLPSEGAFMSAIDEEPPRRRHGHDPRHLPPARLPRRARRGRLPHPRVRFTESREARHGVRRQAPLLDARRHRDGDARPRQRGRAPHPQPARRRADDRDDERLRARHRRPLRARGGGGRGRHDGARRRVLRRAPVYEATDLEGHRWHFGERFDDIRARGGREPVTSWGSPAGPTPDGSGSPARGDR